MTNISCEAQECMHNTRGDCAADSIRIANYYDYCCSEYMDYTDTGDYKSIFWKACIDRKSGLHYREKAFGKRIAIQGINFYTQDDDRDPVNCYLTEKHTGCRVCSLADVEADIDKIKEAMVASGNVMELPERSGTDE